MAGSADPAPQLARRLGTVDAVVVGLGAMIGAGVYSVFGPAADVAGPWLVAGLLVAAAVAYCNATSSAQLAAQYPTSGGTYAYGRERLGPWWGFVAGWGFVVGKTASCAAMALTFATYAVDGPGWLERAVAVGAVLVLVAVNCVGITKTALVARVLLAGTLVALVVVVVALLVTGGMDSPFTGTPAGTGSGSGADVYDVLQSAGLIFFAFAGYARIATLGEEVREPERTIPRAIPLALGLTVALYAAVALTMLSVVGAEVMASSTAPLASAVRDVGAGWAEPVVRAGAAAGSLGALLGLIAGVARTSLAMSRHHDLPAPLAAVSARSQVPARAEIAVGIVVVALVLTADLRSVIGFSSFGVLVYYAVANACAFTQEPSHRRWPRLLQVIGLVGCLVLVATLPWQAVVGGAAVLVVGLAGRGLRLASTTRRPSS